MTKMFVATSIDVDLLHGAAQWTSGRVHSVFSSVVNVLGDDENLWCIATRHVTPGPRTIVTNATSFEAFPLDQDSHTRRVGDLLHVGQDIGVLLGTAVKWTPRPIPGAVLPARVTLLLDALAELGVPGGARGGTETFSRVLADRVKTELAVIDDAALADDAEGVASAAARLVGLGAGLTPTGDDVLVGLAFAAAQLGGPLALIPRAVARALVREATSAISMTALREACRGRAGQPLANLLATLCGRGTTADVRRAVASLTAIGHTSGTDHAYGLLAAVRMTTEMRGLQCQHDPW